MNCSGAKSIVVIPVLSTSAPFRLAAVLVHHRGCEWYQRVRIAIAHPYLAPTRTTVLLVAGGEPLNVVGALSDALASVFRASDVAH